MRYARPSLGALLVLSCAASVAQPSEAKFTELAKLPAWPDATPDPLMPRAGTASPWPGRTRPPCPFPKVARYNGSGNLPDAASFRCE